jgi:hypothetical protein
VLRRPDGPRTRKKRPGAPHICSVTSEERDVQFPHIFDQINAHADGTHLIVVKPDVLAHSPRRP